MLTTKASLPLLLVRLLQQREAVQGDGGFVLAHARALAARKNKTGELGVDHLPIDFILQAMNQNQNKKPGTPGAQKEIRSSFAALRVPGRVRLPRRGYCTVIVLGVL